MLIGRGFGFERAASALGGFLCAYGHIRAAQLHHPQLIPQFFTFLGIWLLCRILREPERRQPVAVLAFFGCLVGQTYASFYLGWFLVLGLAVAGCWGLILPGSRGRVLGAIRGSRGPVGSRMKPVFSYSSVEDSDIAKHASTMPASTTWPSAPFSRA